MRLLRDIAEGVRGGPSRIALALAALSVGMVSLTLLLAVMAGLRERAARLTSELGANVVAILPGNDALSTLRVDLVSLLGANLEGVHVSGAGRTTVASPDGRSQWLVVAADENFRFIRDWDVRAGRMLDGGDVARAGRVAVVTESLARRAGLAPGSSLRIQETAFTIAGIVADAGAASDGQAWAMGTETVFIPRTVSLKEHEAPWRNRNLETIFMRLDPARPYDEQLRDAKRLAASAGRDPAKLSWVTPDSLLSGIRRMQQAVGFAAGGIAALCLALGGMTLMSLMLANVRERVPEIGLRRALGATPTDIAALFILEACLTTLLAALIGGGLAVAVAETLAARFDIPVHIETSVVAIPVLASVLMGAIFAAFPARRAACLEPAEALRNE